MAESVRFEILGPLAVRQAGGEVSIRAPKERLVLGILLLEKGRVVSVDRLTEELWGDRSVSDPVASLRVIVSRLRRRLAASGGGAELRTIGGGYALRVEDGQVDVDGFRESVVRGEALMAEGAYRDAAAAYRSGLELWRGGVLSDLAIGIGSLPAVQRLEEERLLACELRMDAELACGKHANVIAELAELVTDYPLRERLARQLMVALARSGRHPEALRVASALRAALVDIGLQPSPHLALLEADILNHAPVTDAGMKPGLRSQDTDRPVATPAVGADRAGTARRMPIAVLPRSDPYPLVGRTTELDALERLRSEAAAGELRVAVVAGEAGIGKTRVATTILRRAEEDDWLVLFGGCDPQQLRPYHCLTEAVRPMLAPLPPDLRRELVMFDGDVLGRSLADAATGERSDGFDRLARLLRGASESQPLLLVLDDAQWIDPPAAAAVRYLMGALGQTPLMIVMTMRDTDVEAGSVAAELVTQVARTPSAARIDLKGLAEADVADLVSALSGHTLSVDERRGARTVWSRSGGNPYVAAEWARDLIHGAGLAHFVEADGIGHTRPDLPRAARVLLADRMSGLAAETRRILEAAAVLGPVFSVSLLAEVADDTAATISALEECERRRLVEAADGLGKQFAFGHALVRETLLSDIGVARLISLHDRIATVLEASTDLEAHLEQLAFHSLGAAAIHPQRALQHGARAADAALSNLGFEEADRLYRRCLDIIGSGAAVSAELHADVAYGLAACSFRAGHAGFEQAWDRAVEAGRRCGDPHHLARTALILPVWSDIGLTGTVDPERRAVLEEALERVSSDDEPLRCRLMAGLARQLPVGERRRTLLDEIGQLADRIGDAPTELDALVTLVDLGGPEVDTASLVDRADYLVSLADDEIGGREPAALAAVERAHIFAVGHRNRYPEAVSEARRRADKAGQAYFRVLVSLWEVDQLTLAGPLDAAEERFNEAGDEALNSGLAPMLAMAMLGNSLAMLRYHQGRLAELEAAAVTLAELYPTGDSGWAFAAMAWLEAGNIDRAESVVQRLVDDDFAGIARDAVWLPSLGILAIVAARLRARSAAERLLTLLEPYSGRWGWEYVVTVGPIDHAIGELHVACGRPDRALWYLDRALSSSRECEAKVWEAWGHLALAEAHAALGDDAMTRGHRRDALAIAEPLGFRGVVTHLGRTTAGVADSRL